MEVIMNVPFRIIGDVHGIYSQYLNLIKKADFSVQLGDMGFDYSNLGSIDPVAHRFVPGNHENYHNLPPHAFQADWGQVSMGVLDFVYIRGAYSVDKMYRIEGRNWWPEEEMTWASGHQLVEAIAMLQPKYILSHDCPTVCLEAGVTTNEWKIRPSHTSQILQAVWEVWQPDHWIFGHHHHDWIERLGKTRFVCLNSLSSLDIFPEDGKMVINKV
jgi:hypothetical protein